MRIAVFGIGGFGREVAPLARELSTGGDIVFVDDRSERPENCNGVPVIGFDELISDRHRDRHVIVAVGDGRTRSSVERRCTDAGIQIGQLRAPTTRVLDSNAIGAGAVLCDFVTITSNARIGKSFQANIYSYIAHDCVIGDYVTFAPRVSCNGNIHIADYAYIGTNAVFIQGKDERPLTVGEGAIVGMGAVVTKPVPEYTVVAGNPARLVRTLKKPE